MTGRPIVLSLIAAVAENGVIGDGNAMPWRLSTDQRRFKRLTMGKPLIMGRKTFDSIGRVLPGRLNIIVSRQDRPLPGPAVRAASLDAALETAREQARAAGIDEVMVIGGGEIYAATIGDADRLYITHVAAAPEGNARFPAIDPERWRPAAAEDVPAGESDVFASRFVVYERRDRSPLEMRAVPPT